MCMCCGQFAPTQFHFVKSLTIHDNIYIIYIYFFFFIRDVAKHVKTLWKVPRLLEPKHHGKFCRVKRSLYLGEKDLKVTLF